MQRHLRQHTETVAALSSALFRLCTLDVVACSNLKFIVTCMDGRMDGCLCVCACSLMHPCLYVYKHAWKSPNVSSASVFVRVHICTYAYMCVCVFVYIYKIRISAFLLHSIYIFLLHNGAVFHSSGTFILRSTDGYLAFVCLNMTHTAHFVFNTTGFCQFLHLNRQQSTSHRGCLPSHNSILAVVATSVSLLLATIE